MKKEKSVDEDDGESREEGRIEQRTTSGWNVVRANDAFSMCQRGFNLLLSSPDLQQSPPICDSCHTWDFVPTSTPDLLGTLYVTRG